MQGLQVSHYIQRARDFYEGMQNFRGEGKHPNSSALLAIHSAISYSDALRVGLGEVKLASDNHANASVALEKLLRTSRKVDLNGITHLRDLLKMKDFVSYGSKGLDANSLRQLLAKAERFSKWATAVGRQLKLEGWDDGN